jgi:precorrin-3B C17-methyltransferase
LAAAAALLGAPLTHDFAAVSLSDALTPWELIERRLKAAADGDFVLVLHNPRSKTRPWQLGRALEIIKGVKPLATPLGHVQSAFRPGQRITVTTLEAFDPEEADMLSLVFIGNAQTRILGQRMVTPRGYLDKYQKKC